MLKKIVCAGSNDPSFQRGRADLLVLAEVSVGAKQVERLTKQIGCERCDERDAAVAAYLARPLVQREDAPPGVPPPGLAVVEMDGGRLQIRLPEQAPEQPAEGRAAAPLEQGAAPPAPAADEPATTAPQPQDEADRPGKPTHWREQKVGCLLGMNSAVSDVDPCPEIPSVFVDPLRSLTLAREIGQCGVPQGAPFRSAEPQEEEPEQQERRQRPGRPEVETRRSATTSRGRSSGSAARRRRRVSAATAAARPDYRSCRAPGFRRAEVSTP